MRVLAAGLVQYAFLSPSSRSTCFNPLHPSFRQRSRWFNFHDIHFFTDLNSCVTSPFPPCLLAPRSVYGLESGQHAALAQLTVVVQRLGNLRRGQAPTPWKSGGDFVVPSSVDSRWELAHMRFFCFATSVFEQSQRFIIF